MYTVRTSRSRILHYTEYVEDAGTAAPVCSAVSIAAASMLRTAVSRCRPYLCSISTYICEVERYPKQDDTNPPSKWTKCAVLRIIRCVLHKRSLDI